MSYAQERRRERRAAKREEWKAANPLSVGVSAAPDSRPVLSLSRKPRPTAERAVNPIRNEYGMQLAAAIEHHEALRAAADKRKKRAWYRAPRNEMGITCHGRQKMKLGEKPLI